MLVFVAMGISMYAQDLRSIPMSQEAKEKIASNLNANLPRLNGISIQVTLKVNSDYEDEKATYFMEKLSKQIKENFGFYDIRFSNNEKVAQFIMKTDKEYSFPDLKQFVTSSGYRVIEVSDCLIVK